MDSAALTPLKVLSQSAEERGLYTKTVKVSNAAKLNGLLIKTSSKPELSINLDENVFYKFQVL